MRPPRRSPLRPRAPGPAMRQRGVFVRKAAAAQCPAGKTRWPAAAFLLAACASVLILDVPLGSPLIPPPSISRRQWWGQQGEAKGPQARDVRTKLAASGTHRPRSCWPRAGQGRVITAPVLRDPGQFSARQVACEVPQRRECGVFAVQRLARRGCRVPLSRVTTRAGATGASTASWPAWVTCSRPRPCGRSSRTRASIPHPGEPG